MDLRVGASKPLDGDRFFSESQFRRCSLSSYKKFLMDSPVWFQGLTSKLSCTDRSVALPDFVPLGLPVIHILITFEDMRYVLVKLFNIITTVFPLLTPRRLFNFGTFRCGVYFRNLNRRKGNHASIKNKIFLKPSGCETIK